MKQSIFIVALFISVMAFAQTKQINVIPKPEKITLSNSEFQMDKSVVIYTDENEEVNGIAEYIANFLEKSTSTKLQINKKHDKSDKNISLSLNKGNNWYGDEGYSIKIDNNKIDIEAKEPAGLFRATQTLRQMMPASIEKSNSTNITDIVFQGCTITDKPHFAWRGMNLDCSRHFYTLDFVKRYIDLLALHKMNVLHWHLVDDQGWRIEIKKYPLLTQLGSVRTEADGTLYGGFYTQAEAKEIVAYAAERYITVVPEIEMPGHCVAALTAYPHLSCTGGPFSVETNWGVFKDIYCAGNDSVFTFLENVLSEIIEIFPSKYIHIGGDEVPTYNWENCPKCQKRLKDEGLKSEITMQGYFVTRMEKFLNNHDRKIIGWDEILEGGVSNSATIQSWRSIDYAKTAAEHGHNAIVSPTSHCYLDYDLETISLEKIYNFSPIPQDLSTDKHHFILGGEGNMWAERVNQNTVDTKVFPRLTGLSEALWSNHKDYTDFHNRLKHFYHRLDTLGVNYGYESQPLFIDATYNFEKDGFDIILRSGQDGLTFYYTTDGTKPSISSKKYTEKLFFSDDCNLKVSAVRDNYEVPVFGRKFDKHLAINKKYTTNIEFSQSYTAGGNKSLTNGLRGTEKFRDGLWQGYVGNDLEVVIDLEKTQKVKKLVAGFLQSTPSWIFYPLKVEAFVSTDNTNWKKLGEIVNDIPQTDTETTIKDFVVNFKTTKARYVKAKISVLKTCPNWHDAAGSPTWLFIDEITVE